MVDRNTLLKIGQRAAAILRDAGADDRIKDGFTRVDPLAIADWAQVWVMLQPLERLLGAFVRQDVPGILINAERPPGLIHMTCAHELGHFFLGHETTCDEQLDYGNTAEAKEREADWFAYHLLIPRWLVINIVRRKGWLARLHDPGVLYQLSLRLGTSFTATIWTLWHLQLLRTSYAETAILARTPPRSIKHGLLPDGIGAGGDVWLLDAADKNAILEPRAGDRFMLEMPTHASAGYLWSLDEARQAGYSMQPVTELAPSAPIRSDADVLVGGTMVQRYLVSPPADADAERPSARVDFAFKERQPWRPDATTADGFRTSARFEDLEPGLSALTRERLLTEANDL